MKKVSIIILLTVLLTAIIVELVGRYAFGFGNPPIHVSDPDFEYIQAPNQDVTRLGNKIITNEYSMRSKPLTESDSVYILGLGDSVINGGAQTTQDSLATTILENELSEKYNKKVRVLNISAGSWGTDTWWPI